MADKSKAVGDGGDAKGSAQEQLQAAREKFGEVVGGVEQKVQGIRGSAGRKGKELKAGVAKAGEKARERYEATRHQVSEGYDKVTKDLDQLTKDVNDYVRHNPGKAVAIAAGIGFVVGLLFKGRKE